MRRMLAVMLLVAWSLLFSSIGASAQEIGAGARTGGVGTVGGGTEGTHASWTPYSSRAYVDPGLVAAYEVSLSQIAILVVEASRLADVDLALTKLGLEHFTWRDLAMIGVVLPKDKLGDVQGIPGVLVVYRNEHMGLYLDKAAPYSGATVVWNTYKVRGKGTTIMIVDSGVDGTHPDVKYRENLVENVVSSKAPSGLPTSGPLDFVATDGDGHGTHVASIAGGTAKGSLAGQDAGKFHGLAYEANLVGFQAGITDPSSGEVSFESTTVLDAFNYAIAKRKALSISVVSNSWGANGDFDIMSPINIATLNMYKAGLVVVFAAGNEGADGSHTLNKYSVAPWVFSVAAGDYLNQVAKFSSRGTDPLVSKLAYDHPDIVAPGVGITAAKATTANACLTCPDQAATGYTSKSGTSMAAPHVSGIAALLLSANPKLSPDDVMDILTGTATPLTNHVWDAGAGYVNAFKAYQLAVKAPGNREEFLTGKVKYAGKESGDPALARDAVTVGYGQGQAQQLASGEQSLGEFSSNLVATPQGVIFLVGTLVLFVFAFGFGRRTRA